MNIYDIIELEQDIVTGLTETGDVVQNKDISKKFGLIKKKLLNQPKDLLRIICTIHTCLDIPEKDFNAFADGLSPRDLKVITNLECLGISFTKSKSKAARRESLTNKKEKIKELKLKLKNQLEYNTLRSNPKIEGIVELCSRYELSKTDFPFVEDPKNLPTTSLKKYGTGNLFAGAIEDPEDEDLPVLTVFTIGGIAHNEISALERLMLDKKVNHRLIIGSTAILTANDYIDQLRNIRSEVVTLEVNSSSKNPQVNPKEIELDFK